jgi:hypothetical protein
MYSFLCKSTENSKKIIWSSDLLRKGHTFSGQAQQYIRVTNVFFKIWGLWVSEFNEDTININFNLP